MKGYNAQDSDHNDGIKPRFFQLSLLGRKQREAYYEYRRLDQARGRQCYPERKRRCKTFSEYLGCCNSDQARKPTWS